MHKECIQSGSSRNLVPVLEENLNKNDEFMASTLPVIFVRFILARDDIPLVDDFISIETKTRARIQNFFVIKVFAKYKNN